MGDLLEIPIIARGRVIEPGADDSVEFAGRAGARFRAPDPHQHIHDLVLGNVALLADLNSIKMADIIELLVQLGKKLSLDDNTILQQSFDLALRAGGLTEPILLGVYENLPHFFQAPQLREMVDSTIGIQYLDGWVASGGEFANVRVRAIGTRQLHITAGNVPTVAALTIVRSALTKSDCLIKSPSNDPLTASAIARTLIAIAPDHPVTKHIAVAYWRGGDAFMDEQILRPSRIDKVTAWGGMSSVKHIQKFMSPGIDLTAMNPKYSMSVLGKEALETEAAMKEAAIGIAVVSGFYNQTACANTRIVYVESETDDQSLEKIVELGRKLISAYRNLPAFLSTPAPVSNRELESEMAAIALEEDFYHVEGDTINGGFVVSRFSDRVDFYDQLNNRVVNFVPMSNLLDVVKWCDDTTQTVGVYPEALRDRVLDLFSLAGVQRIVPLQGGDAQQVFADMHRLPSGMPHDGVEPMRRNVRWVIDHRPSESVSAISLAAE